MIAVHAEKLTVRRSGRILLEDVTFTAQPGRVTALVGPNGAGKSTLLAALAGDIRTGSGEVTYGDRGLNEIHTKELATLRAVLTQSHHASVPFTAGEVVDFGRAPHAMPDPDLRERLVRACDIAHLLDRQVTVLSGGELARVQLARVLMQDTPILFLDEPTAALDLRHAESVLEIAAEKARAGAVVVVVLHDLSAAAAYADDVVVLDSGSIVATGSPEKTLTTERVSGIYGVDVELLRDSHGNAVIVPVKKPR